MSSSPIDGPQGSRNIQSGTSNPAHSTSRSAGDWPTDLTFISCDDVSFYAHSAVILSRSQNRWDSLLSYSPHSGTADANNNTDAAIYRLPESSDILNVVLHTVYNRSCAYLNPSSHTLVSAIEALVKYGMHLRQYIAPGTPLYTLLLERSRSSPLQFFTVAAQYDLSELATPISALLLTYDVKDIPDEYANQMGPLYLKRLVMLRCHRLDVLKRLVVCPPDGHAPTPTCGYNEQRKTTSAWAFTAASFVLEAGPEITEITLDVRFREIGRSATCPLCQVSLDTRVKDLVNAWSQVKNYLIFCGGDDGVKGAA